MAKAADRKGLCKARICLGRINDRMVTEVKCSLPSKHTGKHLVIGYEDSRYTYTASDGRIVKGGRKRKFTVTW